jgi:large repetitive protein
MLPHLLRRPRKTVTTLLLALVASLPVVAVGLVPAPASAILPTSTTVSASPASSVVGTPVTLTATVTLQGLGGALVTPSRDVRFTATAGGPTVQLGTAQLPAGCLLTIRVCDASLTTSALPVGSVTVTATYVGDSIAATSSGTTQATVAPRPPDAPPTLSATSMVGIVRLVWTAGGDGGSPVTGYRLYRSTSAAGPYTLITGTLPTGHYDDTTGMVGTTYFYRATVVNVAGESPLSNSASGSPQSLEGTSKFDITQCPADQPCTGAVLAATSTGSATTLQAATTASAAEHTLTSAIGGPEVQACTTDYRGHSGTFNDTSTDAYKEVRVDLTGEDALYMKNESPYATGGHISCLGLGGPWQTSPTTTAAWSPADGLYVGTPSYCSEMTSFKVGADEWSQPCLEAEVLYGPFDDPNHRHRKYEKGPHHDDDVLHFQMTFELPPGDGIISGTKCC